MIRGGVMTQSPYGSEGSDGDFSAEEIKSRVKKGLYADLIPRAWRLSNLPLGPFILQSKKKCDKKVPNVEVTEGRNFFVDGTQFILTSPPDPDKNCGYSGDIYTCLEDYKDLSGASKLDGTAWGGLKSKTTSVDR